MSPRNNQTQRAPSLTGGAEDQGVLVRLRARGAVRLVRLVVVFAVILTGWGASPLPVAAASYGACVDSLQAHYFDFSEKTSNYTNIRNVKSNLITRSTTNQFRPCSWNNAMNGVSAWVAIEPGPGNPLDGSPTAILQIGVIACAHYIQSGCDSYEKRLFWAEGGCGLSLPDAQDLGPTDDAYHLYEIRHLSADVYSLRVDGIVQLSFTGQSHSDINCWIGKNYTKAQWAMERWDRGDGIGDSTHKAIFSGPSLMWGDPGSIGATWVSANLTFCYITQPPSGGQSFCDFGSTYMNAYTQY